MMAFVVVWTAVFKTWALGQLRGDVIAGLLYVSNYYQIWVGQGYTAAGDFAPLRHLWSLAVEEQFYVLWPVVMVVLLGRAGTRRVADVSRWLFIAAVMITVIVALLFYPGPTGDPAVTPDAYWWIGDRPIGKIDTLYLGTISRLPRHPARLGIRHGVATLAIVRGPLRSKGRLFDVLAVVAIVFLGWMCWNTYLATPAGADPFLFRGGLFLTSIATLVVIAAITHRGSSANRRLGGSLLVWIGLRSYGIYLYHWPIYQMFRGIAGNKLTLREFVLASILTIVVAEMSFRFIETPIRTGRFRTWRRRARSGRARGPRLILSGAIAVVTVFALGLGVMLLRAPLEQNEIAQALDAGGDFTTNLLDVDEIPVASTTTTTSRPRPRPSRRRRHSTRHSCHVDSTVDGRSWRRPHAPTARATEPATDPAADDRAAAHDCATCGATRCGQLAEGVTPLTVPPTATGFPLVALGDSVMLGAAEELQARGFQVDAVVSRQMKDFVPTMATLRDNGTFGSVVVIHLGTNGPFSQETLDAMLADRGERARGRAADGQGRPGLDRRQQRPAEGRPGHASQRHRRRLGGDLGGL